MAIPMMEEALKRIHGSIQRKKGSFEVSRVEDGFGLEVGSHQAVRVSGGFIICLRLSKEQLEYLKAQCEEALAQKR